MQFVPKIIYACGVVLAASALVAAPAAAQTLTISTLPFDEPANQQAVFRVLSNALSVRMGRAIKFVVMPTYASVINGLRHGDIDVALVGVAAYIRARRGGEVRAILRAVRNNRETYRGVILVARDASFESLTDLRKKRVAFVARDSSAGYVFPLMTFKKVGMHQGKDFISVLAGGHHHAIRLLAAGKVDAAAVFEGASEMLDTPSAVRVLARTDAIPGDPVVVRTGLGTIVINKLRSSLIELGVGEHNPARPFFAGLGVDGFVPVVDSDYDAAEILLAKERGLGQ